MDLYLFNFYFINTILFTIIYFLYPKSRKMINRYFFINYIIFFIVNLSLYNNISYIINPIFMLSFLINYNFFLVIHKNYYI